MIKITFKSHAIDDKTARKVEKLIEYLAKEPRQCGRLVHDAGAKGKEPAERELFLLKITDERPKQNGVSFRFQCRITRTASDERGHSLAERAHETLRQG